ncbi:WSC domain-containing protein [Aspergillus californicus]
MLSLNHLLALYALATSTQAARPLRYLGCFSDDAGFLNLGSSAYQSVGLCLSGCTSRGSPVIALRNGTECWCGSDYPDWQENTSPLMCNMPCPGYALDTCGGHDVFSCYEVEMDEEPTMSLSMSLEPTIWPTLAVAGAVC